MELEGERGAAAGASGLVSLALLGACLLWAHHWGPVTGTLVASWAAAFTGTFVLALGPWRNADRRPWTRLALACVAISLVALAFAGVAAAWGYDPTGGCGGG